MLGRRHTDLGSHANRRYLRRCGIACTIPESRSGPQPQEQGPRRRPAAPAFDREIYKQRHAVEERIRAHVLLCWLALLLIRIAETSTRQTWPAIRRELDRIHLGTFTGPADTFRQRTELTKPARDLIAQLALTPPAQIHELTTPDAW